MKTKKKSCHIKSTNVIKLLNVKTTEQAEKNTASTKEKTFATIQQNLRTFENVQSSAKRQSFRGRFSFNKKSCVQRMQENNLSPFSNDGRSHSPRHMKTPEKHLGLKEVKQQKQPKLTANLNVLEKKKPLKSKVNSARQSGNKKTKQIKTVANNNLVNELKKKIPTKKKSLKADKCEKQEKARIQFQNQFLNMMNNRIHNKKNTEISEDEHQIQIKRKPKLQICVQNSINSNSFQNFKSQRHTSKKQEIVKTMKIKLMKNIQKDYPNLNTDQKKVICAVIIIQRLWRQKKVKQFFQHYVTPKASPETSMRQSFQRQTSSNRSTMNLINHHLAKKSQQYVKFQKAPKKMNINKHYGENNFLMRQKSIQSYEISEGTKGSKDSIKQQTKLNQKVNKLFEQTIGFENQNQKIVKQSLNLNPPAMMKFLECYREIKLTTKKKTKSKQNIFSLKQSLSQKCLMQKYYTKIFSDKPQKDQPKNYELFSGTKMSTSTLKQNQQSSIQLFKQINRHPDYISPRKQIPNHEISQDEQVWVINNTRYSQQTDSDELQIKKDSQVTQKYIAEVSHSSINAAISREIQNKLFEFDQKKEQLITIQNDDNHHQTNNSNNCGIVINNKKALSSIEKPQPSLKSIQKVSDQVITDLMNQFFTQYMGFCQKKCLVKKKKSSSLKQIQKKPRLPGIQITPQSINKYLNILIPYIFNHDKQQIIKSLQLFQPLKYQKCHRVESVIYQIFYIDDQEDDDIYWNIISNEGFFSCLQEYWLKNVILNSETEKFTNFLDLTYKVYNRCVTDAFSQIFNNHVLEMIVYPWDKSVKRNLTSKAFHFNDQIQQPDQKRTTIHKKSIQKIAEKVKQSLLHQSFCYSTTRGKLTGKKRQHKSSDQQFQFGQSEHEILSTEKLSDDEFNKILKIVNDEYLEDQKQIMVCSDQRYELTGDLSQQLFLYLIDEISEEFTNLIKITQNNIIQTQDHQMNWMMVLVQNSGKSEQEIFLQTNQTLQTTNHY